MDFISLSQFEKQIILGGLLGDAYFNKKANKIRFSQGEKQYEYLLWKKKVFLNNINGIYTRNYKEGYVGYYFEFTNKKHLHDDLFEWLKSNLYSREGRKKISLKYLEELTPLGLAIWWLDDGHLSVHDGNRYGKWSTHCFNYEEHILLQKYFKKKWDIDMDIRMEKQKYYFLRFNVKNLRKLISIIYPYVIQIPSMIYKIDLNYTNLGVLKDFKPIYDEIKRHKYSYNRTLETAGV